MKARSVHAQFSSNVLRHVTLWKSSAIACALALLLENDAMAGQSARLVYARTREAAGCSDEHDLRRAVARRLGYDPFVATAVNTVVAELRGDGDGLKARVYLVQANNMAGGTRELSNPTRDCAELMAAVALALSIAIDPDAIDRVEQPNSAAVATADPADGLPKQENTPDPTSNVRTSRSPRKHQNDEPSPTRAPATGLEVQFGVFGFAATGPGPFPLLGLGATAGVRFKRHWVASVAPEWLPNSTKALSGGSSVGVKIGGLGGSVHLGYQSGKLYGGSLYAGALLDVERLTSEGYGVSFAKSDRSLWVGVGTRLAFPMEFVQSLELVPFLDGIIGLKTLQFQIIGQKAHQTSTAVARVGLAVEARF